MVLALATSALAGAAEPARWHAESSFALGRTQTGALEAHSVASRFELITLGPEGARVDRVLQEVITTHRALEAVAADPGTVVASVFDSTAGSGSGPLFVMKATGDTGTVHADLYRVRRSGCCGAADRDVWFDLATGRELLRTSVPLLRLRRAGLPLYVGLTGNDAVEPPVEARGDRSVCAVLAWSDSAGRSGRLSLYGVRPIRCTARSVALAVDGTRRSGRDIVLPEIGPAPALALLLDVELGPPDFASATLLVPLRDGRPDERHARVPAALPLHF